MTAPENRAPFPHCDHRVLHRPKSCTVCDHYPDLQQLRMMWQIAFTGEQPVQLDLEKPWLTEGAVLPCPADYVRGDAHKRWFGNTAKPAQSARDNYTPKT